MSPTRKPLETDRTRGLRLLDPLIHLQGLYFFALEDFLPDSEILKPPEEPGTSCRAHFFALFSLDLL